VGCSTDGKGENEWKRSRWANVIQTENRTMKLLPSALSGMGGTFGGPSKQCTM
jgi:hypothetical protein